MNGIPKRERLPELASSQPYHADAPYATSTQTAKIK